MGNSLAAPTRVNTACDPAIPFLSTNPQRSGLQPPEDKTGMSITALCATEPNWEPPEHPSTVKINKLWYSYTMEYYTVIKTIATCNNMDDSHRCDVERQRSDTKEYMLYDSIYVKS